MPLILPHCLRQIDWQIPGQRWWWVVVFYWCAARNQSCACKQQRGCHISSENRWGGYHRGSLGATTPLPKNAIQPLNTTHSLIHPHYCRVAYCTHLQASVTTACPLVLENNTTQQVDCVVTVLCVILCRPGGSVRSISTLDNAYVHKVLSDSAKTKALHERIKQTFED